MQSSLYLAKSLGSQIIDAMGINPKDLDIYLLKAEDESVLNYNMGQASKYWNIPDNVIPKRNMPK